MEKKIRAGEETNKRGKRRKKERKIEHSIIRFWGGRRENKCLPFIQV